MVRSPATNFDSSDDAAAVGSRPLERATGVVATAAMATQAAQRTTPKTVLL